MITKFYIKNFKSLKKVDVTISNLNLLIGLNGMGKSSFLQTLLLLMQSDKLEEGVINLNGILATIGKGRDALYQYAEDEKIVFGLVLKEKLEYIWSFNYQKDNEKLSADSAFNETQMKVFRNETNQFQYIPVERIGPKDIYEASSNVVTDKKQLGLLGEYAAYFINVFGQEY